VRPRRLSGDCGADGPVTGSSRCARRAVPSVPQQVEYRVGSARLPGCKPGHGLPGEGYFWVLTALFLTVFYSSSFVVLFGVSIYINQMMFACRKGESDDLPGAVI